jgi:hypothetical protein
MMDELRASPQATLRSIAGYLDRQVSAHRAVLTATEVAKIQAIAGELRRVAARLDLASLR